MSKLTDSGKGDMYIFNIVTIPVKQQPLAFLKDTKISCWRFFCPPPLLTEASTIGFLLPFSLAKSSPNLAEAPCIRFLTSKVFQKAGSLNR